MTLLCIVAFGAASLAQTAPPITAAPAQGGVIRGVVKSGNMLLPGVTVSAQNTLTGQKATTSTDVDGSYLLRVPVNGRYVVRAELSAFAPLTHEVVINPENRNAQADMEMILLSRAQQAAAQQQKAQAQSIGAAAGLAGRGFQSLSLSQSAGSEEGSANGVEQIAPAGMPVPGMAENSATESVAVSGNTSNPMGSMSSDEFRERITEAREQAGIANGQGIGGAGGGPGGRGGFGGPGGGFGGPGILVMRGRGFDINRPHGMVYYAAGNSALDASPFSLTGAPVAKPGYSQNTFGGALGGPLNIPHIYNGGTKTFFFLHYNGSHGSNPYDAFSTVPTLAERNGDFSGISSQLYNPYNGQPIAGNDLQNSGLALSPIAIGLLPYIPLPNVPGVTKNFHFIATAVDNSNDLNVRLNHTIGGAAPVGRGGGRGFFRGPRNNIALGVHYHGADSTNTNPFPSVTGSTKVRGMDINGSYIRSIGKLTNIARVDFNRNRIHAQNLYAFSNDITGILGITGVSTNPFDWGLPNLSFTNFGSLSDINPTLNRDQTWSFSDFMIWRRGKHTFRWGGDFRRIEINTETSSNARGSFVFTGLNTAQIISGAAVPGTGYDLADFLLGLPQQTSVQFGDNNYHFRGNSWDFFAQDAWRVRGNLTLNLGVRYEYVSPFSELNDRIANLILSPGVLNPAAGGPTVMPVQPGQGYSGGLVRPDRNNFAPRVGIAWKPFSKTVIRAGYGINYNTGAYQSIAQNLAFQPPFDTSETNVQSGVGALTLQSGFPTPAAGLITNSYAVNPNYRLGYVQIRNLDIQQEIRPTLLLNIDYTGTKGTRLDDVVAPNGGLLGLRIPDAQAFTYQTSLASSSANAGSVRLRKRLQGGVSIGGTYTFSKAIDNASSIGNGVALSLRRGAPASGTTLVAQNALDLAAERGLSSFDQRHKFTADYMWDLPFGHDKRWLSASGPARAILGDWVWSGSWTIASGLPFTPRVLGDYSDVSRGTNGTIRADVVPGVPVAVSDPTIKQWFNTAAFTVPAAGQFGDARRNSIEGPGSLVFDMSMTKVFPMGEMRNLEVGVQAANVFNHPQFATLDTVVNSPTFGQVISVGSMRTIQLSARFRF